MDGFRPSLLFCLALPLLWGCAQDEQAQPGGPATPPSAPVTSAPPARPLQHLILVCIDTVGAETFYSPLIEDELARRLQTAQQFRNAQSVAPWTIPAVSTVFTGLYPVQHRAGQFEEAVANLETDLPNTLSESATTLAEILHDDGFLTASFSGHSWLESNTGMEQGLREIHSRVGRERVVERFREWLNQPRRNPGRYFGYLHFMEAHDWHLAEPEALRRRLAGVEPELHAELLADTSPAACADQNSDICLRNLVYNLAVRDERRGLVEILDALEQRGILADTLVVVFSDHGEEFWEHRAEHERRGDPRGRFGFGHGHSLYQELLHVPIFLWHPEMRGAVRDDLVSLIDLFPTMLHWLDIDNPGPALPGRLLPLSPGRPPDDAGSRVLYASGIAYGPRAVAVREASSKSITYLANGSSQYFDLERDPAEKHPIESDRLVMKFDVLTGDYLELTEDDAHQRPELDEAQLKRLQSIGYLQGKESAPRQPEPADSEAANPEVPK